MKIQKSRNSWQPEKDYSSVCHQQGRMLTDADLTEQALISRDRLGQALRDLVGSGVPKHDGLLRLDESGPTLHWGCVYVDGVSGQVRAASDAPDTGLFAYDHQLYYPQAPARPTGAHRLYVDVWERSLGWLEDESLRDPGLHGADTSARTQTTAQVKWCDSALDPLCAEINPSMGDARLKLVLRSTSTSTDPCDPCADELALNDPVGNYLFRVEVHDVSYDQNDQPTALVLKWSSENGAEAYATSDVPPDFASNQFVYEFFDASSERHLGNHLARDGANQRVIDGQRADLIQPFDALSPQALSYVRRWDGWCRIEKNGDDWTVSEGFEGNIELSDEIAANTPGHINHDEGSISIELRALSLTLELADHPLLAGDYWHVPVREVVHQPGDILLQDADGNGVPPQGEPHHYLLLVDVADDGSMTLPAQSECDPYQACQPFVFPSLTDLRTRDICYTQPDCADPSVQTLLADQEPALQNQQVKLAAVLDALLCRTNTSTIPLDKQSELCGLLQDSAIVTVQDALNALCAHENAGCATFTVAPSANWFDVFDQIPSGGNAHICFLEGDYRTSQTVRVRSKGHLKITAAGQASRFICADKESVISFEQCQSVNLDDGLYIAGRSGAGSSNDPDHDDINGALTFRQCAEVNLRRLVLRCAAGTRLFASCLTVHNLPSNPGSVRIQACRAEVGYQQIGFLLLNQDRVTVEDNIIQVRKKPKSMTVDAMLKDHQIARNVRDLMVREAVVRDFNQLSPTQRTSLQNVQINQSSGGRQVMLRSPIAGSHWRRVLETVTPGAVYATNTALLGGIKHAAVELLRNPPLRANHSTFASWIAELNQQNPAVMRQGIVCGGSHMREVRISNNTLQGVLLGIQIGVSDRSGRKGAQAMQVGRTRIEGNSVQVQLSPLADRRRGGIFVGNCSQLSLYDNSVRVQRFRATSRVRVESIRVYGFLGRKIILKDNFSSQCDIGARITPLGMEQKSYQWLVADNLFDKAVRAVQAPDIVKQRNNLT
jgi:hypothetical protein